MKKVVGLLLPFIFAFGITACSTNPGESSSMSTSDSIVSSTVLSGTSASSTGNSAVYSDNDNFSFGRLSFVQFWFGSGSGGWCTMVKIWPDGSFSGYYSDFDMGNPNTDHPNGIVTECSFGGKFTALQKTGAFTYSMKCESLTINGTVGEEKIIDGVQYITADPYGFDQADEFILYLPGKKVSELPEPFWQWIAWQINGPLYSDTIDILPCYGLYNVGGEEGFSTNITH